MIKAVIILGLAAIGSAQLLRISPAVIGSSTPGQQQVIQLAAGGGLGAGAQSYQPQNVQTYKPQNVQSYKPQNVPVVPVSSGYAQQPRPVATYKAQSVSSSYQASQPVARYQPSTVQVVPSYQPSTVQVVPSYQSSPVQAVPAPSSSYSASRYSQEEQSAPTPYSFQFDSEDQYGTKLGRQESANEQGIVTGSYTLSDANGIARIVNYVADENGFRATVQTNEPGTETSNPANVQIQSSYAAPSQQ